MHEDVLSAISAPRLFPTEVGQDEFGSWQNRLRRNHKIMDNLYVTPNRVSLRFLDEFELILETNGTFSVLDGAGDVLYNTEDRHEALILTQKAFTDKIKQQKKASNIGRVEQKVLAND